MYAKRSIAILLAASMGLSACANDGGLTDTTKKVGGAGLAGLAGAVACSQVGGGTGKLIAMAACAIGAGGAAYVALDEYLDDEERQQVNEVVHRELNDNPNSKQTAAWTDPGEDKRVDAEVSKAMTRDTIEQKVGDTSGAAQVKLDRFPENTVCRRNTNRVSVAGDVKAKNTRLYCRTAQGNWKRVEVAAAS